MRDYISLTKPGMVRGNMLAASAAFIFASAGSADWPTFFLLISGLSLIIGSACIFNNYYDRFIDAHMERTKERALAAGRIWPRPAIIFGAVLFVIGSILLLPLPLSLAMALLGFAIYVFAYTPLKHKTGHALWVGALAGAMPPLAGYAAAAPLDIYSFWLFFFMFLWQIPHFIAIAVFRFDEYKSAGVPLLIKNAPSTKARSSARLVFRISLVILLMGCLALAAHPYLV